MRRYFYILLLCWLCYACSSTTNNIEQLTGYWSIEKAILPDGSEREFPFSNHMDYFTVTDNHGSKHRVSPTYDGGFVNYGSPVNFTWNTRNDTIVLHFKDGTSAYDQAVLTCSKNVLVLKHENGTTYHYSAYQPKDEK